MSREDEICEFWAWFQRHARLCESAHVPDHLVGEIDDRVRALGEYTWEIGPGSEKPFMFVLSPGGRSELLRDTAAVVGKAPSLEGWEFHSAKPPKQWNLVFDLRYCGSVYRVVASNWKYKLLKYSDGKFDIDIYAPEIELWPDDVRQTAARIVVDGILGEEMSLRRILRVEIHSASAAEGSELNCLREHLLQACGES